MARAKEVFPVPGGPNNKTAAGGRKPTRSARPGWAKGSTIGALEQLLGGGEPLHVLPEPGAGERAAVALDDLELLGHHRGGPDEQVKPVGPFEPLVGERHLAHLARFDQGEQAVGAVMDHLLVQGAEQRRPDASVAPLGMEGQGEEMGVTPGHARHGRTHEGALGQRHGSRLVLVERLDHVTAAVGGGGRGAGQVDQADDLLEGRHGIAVVQRKHAPVWGHAFILVPQARRGNPRVAPDLSGPRPGRRPAGPDRVHPARRRYPGRNRSVRPSAGPRPSRAVCGPLAGSPAP